MPDRLFDQRRWAKSASWLLGAYVLVGGLISLLGWAADRPRLTDWENVGISIQPNTTVAAMAAGAALLSLTFGRRWTTRLLGAVALFIGGSVIFQYVTGIDLGIDTLLMFDRTWGRGGVLYPGRMGPPGAISWTLIGLALVLATIDGSRAARSAVPALALVTTAIASLSLIGYLYGASDLFTVPTVTVIALQTSTYVLAMSIGLMFSIPEHGPTRLLSDDGPAGALARRILPALIGVPIILGLVRIAGDRAGLYDVAFGTAVRTLLEIALLMVLFWWASHAIGVQARHRKESERRFTEILEEDLAASQVLQRLSAATIHEDDLRALYEQFVDAAVCLARSDFASMQALHPERSPDMGGELKLLACRGFPPAAAERWQWIRPDSRTTCGLALGTRQRVTVTDVTTSDVLSGTSELAYYREIGMRAMQSTPLISRDGRLLGMISTHWKQPRTLSERELHLIDVLARQAADVLERREADAALRDADRRKNEFLATLAHELRNPLAPIRTAADLMSRQGVSETDQRRARTVIERQVGLMARLLDDLLDVSRISNDRLELRKERVDLGRVLEGAIEMYEPIARARQHEIEASLPSQPILLDADPARLDQIFGNLLNNACRYTEPGGLIALTLSRDGPDAVVTIRDTGVGIPADKLTSIFEMFAQVDRAQSGAHTGLGIGLHLVKRLVAMHDGTVDAKSEGLGLGSEFVVRIPAPGRSLNERSASREPSVPLQRA